MEATELRSGNLVKSAKGIYKIFALSKTQVLAIQPLESEYEEKVFSTDGTILKPIPLTEEWLIKLGAKYKPCGISGADIWQGMGFWTIKDKTGMTITFRGSRNPKNGIILYPYFNSVFKYLHEFQNIIKDITKEELTLTAPTPHP